MIYNSKFWCSFEKSLYIFYNLVKNGVTLCLRKKSFIFISALCHLWLKLVEKFWKRIYLKVDNTFSLFFFFMESLLYMVIQVAGSSSYSTFVVSNWPVHTFKQVYYMVLIFHKKENAHFSFLYFFLIKTIWTQNMECINTEVKSLIITAYHDMKKTTLTLRVDSI